jgi:pimeloyl-ACP methyl ester carboxylesterase
MALPFPKKKNNFKSLISNDQEGFWWKKAWLKGKNALANPSKPLQSLGLIFEALEPRILMSADLSYGDVAADLTLHFDQQANEFQLLSVDANGQNGNVQSLVAADAALTDGILSIGGNGLGNTLRLDVTSLQSLNIEFLDSGSNDNLVAKANANFTLSGSILDIADKTFSLAGFENLSLQGGAGNNKFAVDDSAVSVSINGGTGNDSLAGSSADSTWNITGANAGNVGNVKFSSVENLHGAINNEDTFVFGPAASIDGLVDGGQGGFDTLVLEGDHTSISYTATGPNSGIIGLDDKVVLFKGLEPVTFSGPASDLVVDLSAVADAALLTDTGTVAGQMKLEAVNLTPSFESPTFANPTNSLTIRLGDGDDSLVIDSLDAGFTGSLIVDDGLGTDSVTLKGTWSLASGNLMVNAEKIEVNAHITTTGNVTLTAIAENNIAGSLSPTPIDIIADILVDGQMDVGGSLILDAMVNNTVNLAASGVSLSIESESLARARIGSTAIVKAGNLKVSAVTNTDFSVAITDAIGGYSGVGDDVVDAASGNATLLNPLDSGPAKFYLWGATNLNTNNATYVVTHGWTSGLDHLGDWIELLNALKAYDPTANVIFTDWAPKAQNPIYPISANDTYEIGGLLADFLEAEQIDPITTTLIGHSLGGQVSGIAAGQYKLSTGNSIARIFALDPAGPVFETGGGFNEKPLSERLDANDADRVVVLHTTTILGYDAAVGDLDLYVNPDTWPLQPGEANFIGSHTYAVTLLSQLLEGKSFSQAPDSLILGDFDRADLFDNSQTNLLLTGDADTGIDVATNDSPIEITTIAAIEGGAFVTVGTTPLSASETASVLVQAIDTTNVYSSITTGSTLSDYDFVQGKIGLNRDTRAYIGDANALRTILNFDSNSVVPAAGIVKVTALNSGNVSGEVFSDFLEFRSTTFARENVLAYVENTDLNAAGIEVTALSESKYATAAEENSNTVRAIIDAYIDNSFITAGAAGVVVSANVTSSYTATSKGQGNRNALNDIKNDLSASATNSTITATGPISIVAANWTTLNAESILSATDASSDFADSAIIFAVNVVNGDVEAFAENSSLTTTDTGDIIVSAGNQATINAKVKADAVAETTYPGFVPALSFGEGMTFNAVGWDMAGVLLATIGDFLGDLSDDFITNIIPVAENTPAKTRAYLLDTEVDADGDLIITSDSAPQINATVSNAASSTASSMFGAVSGTLGGVLASNKINSSVEAWIDFSLPGGEVSVGGSVAVSASDNASIYANSKMTASSVTTNDGGVSLIGEAVNDSVPVDFDSNNGKVNNDGTVSYDGPVSIAFGDRVLLADDFAQEDYSSEDGEQLLANGVLVKLADDYATPNFTSDDGVRLLRAGDVVQLADDYQGAFGIPGGVYRYIGEGSRGLRVDLSAEDYTDTNRWQAIGGTNGTVYQYIGSDEALDLGLQDYSDTTLWREIVGDAGDIYQYMGGNTVLDLTLADFSDLNLWKLEPVTQLIPTGQNLTDSDALTIGTIIVLNDVRSDVEAFVRDAIVTADTGIDILALENAVIRADTDSVSNSSGGSVFGNGMSLALNATIASNIVLSKASAFSEASNLTADGAISVLAQNLSQIDATTRAAANSGQNSAPIVLAFNTVGWEAQDLFSNTLDALLGMTSLGTEQPAIVEAYLLNTQVTTASDLTITADSAAHINALVTNDATSYPVAFFAAAGMSASAVLSSNMVSSKARAYIDYSTAVGGTTDIVTGGTLAVTALDDASISAVTNLYAEVSPVNDAATGLLNNLAGTLLDDYQYTNASGSRNLLFGDKVLVTDDYYPADFEVDGSDDLQMVAFGNIVHLTDDYYGDSGEAGGQYKFIGTGGAIELGSEDYSDTTRWVRVGGTYQYMGTAGNKNLGTADYTDFGLWKRLNPANLITDSTTYAALSVVGTAVGKELVGSSESYYALIDRNDVRSEVLSYIDDAEVSAAGDIALTALESATISALEDSYVVPWTGRGGIIATNNVLSQANTFVTDSNLNTGGNLDLYAENQSLIGATSTSKVEAWDSTTAVLAFNSIGWDAQNILFNTLDALIGDPLLSEAFNGEHPAEVQAYIVDSTVAAAGDINLTALSTAQINAYVGNENLSYAELDIVIPGAMEDASAVAGGGVLASNKVSSIANAYIEYSGTPQGQVTAVGALTVHAEDHAGITSDSVITQVASASNTLSGVVDQINALLPGDYDFTTKSGQRMLDAYSGAAPLVPGDRVRIADDYDVTKGDRGAVYEYRGNGGLINFGNQNYNDSNGPWHKLVGGTDNLEDLYPGIGNITNSDATAVGILVVMNDVRSAVDAYIHNADISASKPLAFDHDAATDTVVGLETGQRVRDINDNVFEYLGESGEIDLSLEDFDDAERWRAVGAVNVHAFETVFIQSTAETNVEASGGSFYGDGTVLAVNGQVVTNVVLSSADASISDSIIETTGAGISVLADNRSGIDATILAATTSGDTGVGITLAFNSVGWQSQNFLFNAIDALIGGDLLGDEQPAYVSATITDSRLLADGDIIVQATNEALINATVSNAATSAASALFGATGKSIGGILASNRVSSKAFASIDYTAAADDTFDVNADGSIQVLAQDNAGIYANSKIVNSSTTTNDGGASVLQETVNDFIAADYQSSEGNRQVAFGDQVRLDDDYANGGNGGGVYRYLGTTADIDLTNEDYSNLDYWKPVTGTEIIPQGNNVSASSAQAIGGLVVRNDVRSDVDAIIKNANIRINDGDLSVVALESAEIVAAADASATASGGSAYGTGTVVAVNAVIATNMVLSQADATVSDSRVTVLDTDAIDTDVFGNVTVHAGNTSLIDASVLNAVTSGDTAAGVTLAFNTVGWQAENLLFQSLDALLGTDLGTEDKAGARAVVTNTTIDADDDVAVTASMDANITANVGNEATSAAAALFGATGLSFSAVLASNMVSTEALATVGDADDTAAASRITAGGAVQIEASESAAISAENRMLSTGSTSNDGGASLVNNFANTLLDEYHYTTKSGTQTLRPGDLVYIASDHDSLQGVPGALYQYTGQTPATIDLDSTNFTANGAPWQRAFASNVVPAFGNVSPPPVP